MCAESFPDILSGKGFRRIGAVEFQLSIQLWWHPLHHVQLLLIPLAACALVRGDTTYYLQTRRGDDESWVRDIEGFAQYLETHFANDLRISFSYWRDLPQALAAREAKRHLLDAEITSPVPGVETIVETIAALQRQLECARHADATMNRMMQMSATPNDLLGRYLQRQARQSDAPLRRLEADLHRQQQRHQLSQQLQREYLRKGSGAVFTFSVASNLHLARMGGAIAAANHAAAVEFADAVDAIVAELQNYHRHQITQKLNGGRLKIQVEKAAQPALNWIELWCGGALSPQQLHRLTASVPAAAPLVAAADEHIAVTPNEAIKVDGSVRAHPQHLAAHIVRSMVSRIDVANPNTDAVDVAEAKLMLNLGITSNGEAAVFALKTLGHMLVSGTTGSGKSIFLRTLCEEAARHAKLNLLVLDPRNQAGGALLPEDRPTILRHYQRFGMQTADAAAMDMRYFAPGSAFTPPLPAALATLADGRTIVSFKHLDETQRCNTAADILNAVFEKYARDESEQPRLLIVIDEAQLFLPRLVSRDAASAAARCEQVLDRIGREARKHGLQLCCSSQSIKSFSHGLAVLRQMAASKFFFRNSDLELQSAAEVLPDPKVLVNLRTGEMILHNAAIGTVRINVRPPKSRVGDVDDQTLKTLLTPEQTALRQLSPEAAALLGVIEAHAAESQAPMNMSALATRAKISSRRKLHALIDELEQAQRISTHALPERGKPRVVQLLLKHKALSE